MTHSIMDQTMVLAPTIREQYLNELHTALRTDGLTITHPYLNAPLEELSDYDLALTYAWRFSTAFQIQEPEEWKWAAYLFMHAFAWISPKRCMQMSTEELDSVYEDTIYS